MNRLVGLAMMMGMLFMSVPSGAASASPSITVTPTTVSWGAAPASVITITGQGFHKNEQVFLHLTLDGVPISLQVGTDSNGGLGPVEWQMDDPYNASQTDPWHPTTAIEAEIVVENSGGKVLASAPFTILPGDNTQE